MKNKLKTVLGVIMACVMTVSVCTSCDAISGILGNLTGSNSSVDEISSSSKPEQPENIAVKEISLSLPKLVAKIGDELEPTVSVKPNNATNKEYTVKSSDDTIAKFENGKIVCLAPGTVVITARSSSDISKKAEVTLKVLGTDEQGRVENLFEAEEATIIGEYVHAESVIDERLTGTGAVVFDSYDNTLKTFGHGKGDRIIFGVNSDAADDNAELTFKMMGPSGWLGRWDAIGFNFADWYTVKVNGKTLDTENIYVEGTTNRGSSQDNYNVRTVTVGNISLVEGQNTITFVLSNRFDQWSINDGTYNGNIRVMTVDSISVWSSKNLTFTADAQEVPNADPDTNFKQTTMEVEAETTRIYEDAENNDVDLNGANKVDFKANMNVLFGMNVPSATKARFSLKMYSPYGENAAAELNVSDILKLNVNGEQVSLKGLTVASGADVVTDVVTGWIDLEAGEYTLGVVVRAQAGMTYLGGLDSVTVETLATEVTPFHVEAPQPETTVRFEAEAETTRLVDLTAGDTAVEFVDRKQVQTDVYAAKYQTSKIIFGIESNVDTFATIKMRVASPYVAGQAIEDVGLGSLGDLWVNGTLISTPEIISGCENVDTKENYSVIEITEQVELKKGKNRIQWEPTNYTGNAYDFLGALDYIEVDSGATLTPYKVNFWTDRNTYFDDAHSEPILVTCDTVSESTPDNTWIGVWEASCGEFDDGIVNTIYGSIYWWYPNGNYSGGSISLGDTVNAITQNPTSETHRHIGAETGGFYYVVYMEWDSKIDGYYKITDMVKISVWNDPDVYGGRLDA